MQGHANIIWFLFSFHGGMGAHTDTHSCKGFIFVSDQSMFIRLNKKKLTQFNSMCVQKRVSVFNYILYPMLLKTYPAYIKVLSIDGLKIGACMYPIVFVCVCEYSLLPDSFWEFPWRKTQTQLMMALLQYHVNNLPFASLLYIILFASEITQCYQSASILNKCMIYLNLQRWDCCGAV